MYNKKIKNLHIESHCNKYYSLVFFFFNVYIAWYLIISLNISRIMTLRFKFSVKILIKIQTKRKRCIVYLVVVTTFFFFFFWVSFGYGIWNNDYSKNVSILYPTPCELMTTGNLGPMSDFFFFFLIKKIMFV